ncbi:MAG TPA: hypothetical protein VGJ34_08780 [Gaiellaceae bacterium]
MTTLEQLDLGTGAHVLLVKVGLSKSTTPGARILCTLAAGTKVDRASVRLPSGPAATTAHLLLATELSTPGTALVRCRHYSGASARVFAAQVQISAIKVGTLTAVTPAPSLDPATPHRAIGPIPGQAYNVPSEGSTCVCSGGALPRRGGGFDCR